MAEKAAAKASGKENSGVFHRGYGARRPGRAAFGARELHPGGAGAHKALLPPGRAELCRHEPHRQVPDGGLPQNAQGPRGLGERKGHAPEPPGVL